MIKNNLLGQILIALLVLFLLIGSLQMFGIGQGLEEVEITEENQMDLPALPNIAETEGQNASQNSKQLVGNITTRPIFSDDRLPFVPEVEEEQTVDVEGQETLINELKAQLTGVVITPEQSYAMILDSLTNERETYKIGMPLQGEQGGWTLAEIHQRKVVFVSDDEKSEELELAVYSESLKAGGATGGAKNKNNPAKTSGQPQRLNRKDKKKNADDIRKKIAERRAQMRAEAAKKK